MLTKIKTPCIGVCSTGIGDSVCRGCKRYTHEVINWNAYTEEQREAILARIESLLTKVLEARIDIVDESMLKSQLIERNARVSESLNSYTLVYEALRTFGAHLPNLKSIGCVLKLSYTHLTLAELKEDVEQNLYELSCAHYERYFPDYA